MRCVLKAAEALRPDSVVVLGDWLSCELFSPHPAGALEELEGGDWFADEVDPCRYYLAELKRWSGRIVFLQGNHEHWVERWIATKPAGRLALTLERVLSPRIALSEHVDEWIPYSKRGISYYAITPNLWAVHGWSHARHAAYQHLLKGRGEVSIVHGHTHRMQSVSDRLPASDRRIVAWSPGCLTEYNPRYNHSGPDGWLRGFSVVYVSRRDPTDFTEYSIPISNEGRATLPDGRKVRADK